MPKEVKSGIKRQIHPDKALPGDILFCDHSKHPYLVHCAMYIGNDFYIEALPFYGVRKLSKTQRPWIWDKYEFGYVKKLYQMDKEKREDIIEKAIRWAKRRRWSRYQWWLVVERANYNPWDLSDPTSLVWYCSELIWAAYMNASDKEINISNAKHIEGSRYEFVDVASIKESGEIEIFNPKDPPIPKRIKLR